jgi:ATP-dependent DNA helicase PIF1
LRSHAHRAPYNLRTRSLDRILNYFPRYSANEVEDYGRAKLMLHHPFRKLEDLLFSEAIHDERSDSYFEAYDMCRERCNHPHDAYDDPLPEPEPSVHEDTQEDPDEEALNNMDAEWGEVARTLPDRNGGNFDAWDMLGRRPEDRVDWGPRVGSYPDLQDDWWKIQKAEHPILARALGVVTPFWQLEAKQKLLWNTFVDHYNELSVPMDQLFAHVDGKAGTGKTTVIMSMCAVVDRLASELSLPSLIFRAAPTGVAACNFSGSTLHSLLRLPVKDKTYQPLSPSNLRVLQKKFKSIRYLIIVSIRKLRCINKRLCEIIPGGADNEPFAGVNVIRVGDYFQLPPVREKSLYNIAMTQNPDLLVGQQLYRLFNRTITLNVVKR